MATYGSQSRRRANRDDLKPVEAELEDIVVSSLRNDGRHSPVLDIDYQARLLPSATPGHFHLYLDGISLPWWKYQVLLKVLAWAGVIERGYYRHSVGRQMTCVRAAHVPKP
jgi:hypothetical protein